MERLSFWLKGWAHEHGKTALAIALAVVIGTLSFGLGYLYARNASGRAPIIIEQPPK